MHLTFIIGGNESYGVGRITASLLEECTRQGIETSVISAGPGQLAEQVKTLSTTVIVLPEGDPTNFQRGLKGVLAAIRIYRQNMRLSAQVASCLRRAGADAAIVQAPNLILATARASKRLGVASIWMMPNAVSSNYRANVNKTIYELIFLRYGIYPVANSHYTRSTLLNFAARSYVAHLGVDSRQFSPTGPVADRANYNFAGTDIIIGIFARLVPEKGQLAFLRAFARATAVSEHLSLLICGGPLQSPYADELLNTIAELGLEKRVRVVPPVSDPAPLIAMCDIIANPRLDPEPFGLSVVEAMMMARPVLANASGGPSETIIDGETGWLVREATVSGFEAGILTALADAGRWRTMGSAAHLRAMQHFEISVALERLLSILDEVTP